LAASESEVKEIGMRQVTDGEGALDRKVEQHRSCQQEGMALALILAEAVRILIARPFSNAIACWRKIQDGYLLDRQLSGLGRGAFVFSCDCDGVRAKKKLKPKHGERCGRSSSGRWNSQLSMTRERLWI